MDLADWLLALHLIAAALLVGAMLWSAVIIVAARRAASADEVRAYLRAMRLSVPLVGAGSVLVLLLGLWLAIDESAYHPWDLWILIAIVLWLVASAGGQRAGAALGRAASDDGDLLAAVRAPEVLSLQIASLACVALILLDMIFKPGA